MSTRYGNMGHHRNGRNGSGRGGRGNIFTLIGSILVLCLIIAYWQVIVALAILCAVIWLIWVFRRPIGQAIIWISTKLWDVLTMGCQEIQKWYVQRKKAQNAGSPGPGPQDAGPQGPPPNDVGSQGTAPHDANPLGTLFLAQGIKLLD